jgi:hypothetical protein
MTPNGITRIGIMPQPEGTQVLLTSGANRMTRIATTETITLPTKAKARYFSREDSGAELPAGEESILELGFLAILLEYWLG